MVDNKDGTYTVTYVPLTSGMYTLLLKYGGAAVPGFPTKVKVDPAVDTSEVKVFGPGVQGKGEDDVIYAMTAGLGLDCSGPELLPSSLLQAFSEKPQPSSRWMLVL